MLQKWFFLSAVATVLGIVLGSCSVRHNTPAARNWEAFNTRYNVYFNGDEHFRAEIKRMEDNYEDDYTSLLLPHPARAIGKEGAPQPTGDFKRTIEKMQKAIQLHSIKRKPARKTGSAEEKKFRAREEFNPFLHNAWMRMGEAQYFSGDFAGAAATFSYIAKHFYWLPSTVTDARLWQARAYCALGWIYEAADALRSVNQESLDKHQRELYDFVMAEYYMEQSEFIEAIPYLERAAARSKGMQYRRLNFLLGQLYERVGRRDDAYRAFETAGGGVSTPYRAKLNARIKRSEVYPGGNADREIKGLQSLEKYARNADYLDQIHYAIGNLQLSRHDTVAAIASYSKAASLSSRKGIEMGMALLAKGRLLFDRRDYVGAQPCYAEALPLLGENYPGFAAIKRRSDVLDEMSTYAAAVALQDSLLALAALPRKEQLKICRRLAEEASVKQKKESDDAEAMDESVSQDGTIVTTGGGAAAPTAFQMSGDGSWYFYNPALVRSGRTEFQRRWGARKLEDDWRRRNKTSFAFTEEEESGDGELKDAGGEMPEKKIQPLTPEYFMAQIPHTPEQKAAANEIVAESLYAMGVILKNKLEDYPAAADVLERLLERYPDNPNRLDALYNLYLIAALQGQDGLADYWRGEIVDAFPESPYGQAMSRPGYFERLKRMHTLQDSLYDRAYEAYVADDNATVHKIAAEMEQEYPLSNILHKLVFLDALSYLGDKQPDVFQSRIEELLRRWPDTDLKPVAGNIMRGLKDGLKPHAGSSNNIGIVRRAALASDSGGQTALGGADLPEFTADASAPQYLVLAFPIDAVNANKLLYDVARFNFSSFVVSDFDLEQMHFGGIGLLIIKGFNNLKELERYRKNMSAGGLILPEDVTPVMISKSDFELLLREGRSFDDYFRFVEDKENLPPNIETNVE